MSISVLGPFRAGFGTNEATPSGARLRNILAVLALRADSEVHRDELIEELDLMRTTGDAVNALHAHIARIRRWLQRHGGGPDVLETVNSGYRLNVDRGSVDAHRFVDLVERAMTVPPGAASVVAAMLREALLLWRGDALSDTLDGPLVAAAADELHQWRAAARGMLVDAWLSLGDHQKVALNARRFIAADPLNESMRARYIVALRRMGRHAEAAEAYRDARKLLSDELGIEPGAELRGAVKEVMAPAPVQIHGQRGRRMFGARV